MSSKKITPRKDVVTVGGVGLTMQLDLQEKVHKTFMERMTGRNVITSRNQAHNLTKGEKGRPNEKKKNKDQASSSLQPTDSLIVASPIFLPSFRSSIPVPPIPPLRTGTSSSTTPTSNALRSNHSTIASPGSSKSHTLPQKSHQSTPYASHTPLSVGNPNKKIGQSAIPSAHVQRASTFSTPIPPTKKKNGVDGGSSSKNNPSIVPTGAKKTYSSPLPSHVTPKAKTSSNSSLVSQKHNPAVDHPAPIRDSDISSKKRPKETSQGSFSAPPAKKKNSGPSAAASASTNTTNEVVFKTPNPPENKSVKKRPAKTLVNSHSDDVLQNTNSEKQCATDMNATASDSSSKNLSYTSTKSFKYRSAINPLLKLSSIRTQSRSEPQSSNADSAARKRLHSDTLNSSSLEPPAKRLHPADTSTDDRNRLNWSQDLLKQRDLGFTSDEALNKYTKMVIDDFTKQKEIHAKSPAREKSVVALDTERRIETMRRKCQMLWLDERGPNDPPKEFSCTRCGGTWMKVVDLRRTNKDTGAKEVVRSLVCRDICCMVIMKQNVTLEVGRLFGRPKQEEMQFRRSRADPNCCSKSSKRLMEYLADLRHYVAYAKENKTDVSCSDDMYIQVPGQRAAVKVL